MRRVIQKTCAVLVTSILVAPAGAYAESSTGDERRDRPTAIPALRLPRTLPRAAVADEFRFVARPLAQQQQRRRSWPGRHPVLFGALLGFGIGLGVEAAVIPGASGGEPHSVYIPMFGGIGAGIGSLVGVVVSVARR